MEGGNTPRSNRELYRRLPPMNVILFISKYISSQVFMTSTWKYPLVNLATPAKNSYLKR